jgi:Zn-dependent protease with chaperone function
MTQERFDQMVSELETKYRNRHGALARRAVTYAVLGYAGLALALLLSAAITAVMIGLILLKPGFLTIKVGLVVGVPAAIVTWAVLKGVWVRLDAPEGLPVTRQDSPKLFAMIDEISRQAGGVNFQQVLLTDDLNAAVVQVPRLGIFGWHKTYLLLGLPLMDAMSPDEFKAVVAHEFAHLSHQHGRLGNWIYRLRASWVRVMESLAKRGAPGPMMSFVNWFWPRFNASAFVLSRSQEYQADAFAAKVTSPQASANGLQRLAVESRRLSDYFWDNVGRETSSRATPPEDVFHRMQAFLGTEPDRGLATRWLAGALAMETDTTDTHPGLTDRLSALGVTGNPEALPPLPDRRASDEWLEVTVSKQARDRFSQMWSNGASPHWQEMHCEKQELKKQLDAIDPARQDTAWQRLLLRSQLHGPASIQDELTTFLAEQPGHPMANYFRGRYLAEEDDDRGIPHLERAAAKPDLTIEALGVIAGLYGRTGRTSEITALRRRAEGHDAKMKFAMEERNNPTLRDTFLPPQLSPQERESLIAAVRRHPSVKGAWVVAKEMKYFPEWPGYFLALDIRGPMGETAMAIVRQILADFATDAYCLALLRNSDHEPVAKLFEKVEGAQLSLLDPSWPTYDADGNKV